MTQETATYPWQPGGDVYYEVTRIVSEIFRVPAGSLTPQTHFGYDLRESLQMGEVIVDCEQFFGLEIPDAEAERLETVGLLAAHIEQRVKRSEQVWPPAPKRPLGPQ